MLVPSTNDDHQVRSACAIYFSMISDTVKLISVDNWKTSVSQGRTVFQ